MIDGQRRATRRVGPVGAGLAPRQPAVQRGRRAARARRTAGTRSYPVGRRGVRGRTSSSRSWRGLLPVLYPKVFPNLAALKAAARRPGGDPADGAPAGVVPGFQNYTGKVLADQLRLNVAIPPTTSTPSRFGLLGDDLAGFPNGRRVFDDVVSIELRAIAGVDATRSSTRRYTPDAAAGLLDRGPGRRAANRYQSTFPYLGAAARRLRHARRASRRQSQAPGAADGAQRIGDRGKRCHAPAPAIHDHRHDQPRRTDASYAARQHPEFVVLDIGERHRGADRPHRPGDARRRDRDQPGRRRRAPAQPQGGARAQRRRRARSSPPCSTASPAGALHAVGRRRAARARDVRDRGRRDRRARLARP